ncbi:MAG: hypothetical protein CMO41_04420 [Verrucomicrobiales bacterium]|nr:hypothetical protein [Verrucomicrobiales bacterium]
MSLVVAIDVGIKNLAICAFDFITNKVVHWDNVTIVPNGRYIPAQNVQYVRDFVQRHDTLFSQATAVVVERQMRCNMRIIEALLQCMFYDRCYVINARCVKMHYNLSTRNYRSNKAKAVEWAGRFIAANPDTFADNVTHLFTKGGKQDDLADALLLVMYYLDTYSNQLNNQ